MVKEMVKEVVEYHLGLGQEDWYDTYGRSGRSVPYTGGRNPGW